MLTKDQIAEYLNNGGAVCPYCGNNAVVASGETKAVGIEARQQIVCFKCNKEWVDVYKLTGIEEVEKEVPELMRWRRND